MMDLAAALIHAIEARRDEINSSCIANGESGRVEILVNPKVCSLRVIVLVEDKRVA